ncbi:hypothetical protein C8J56DRAFT_965073 [Mycena floridula]|nr:hypothetical protein C8J56DRAFT_965073 [Mycena floridula]
MTTQLFTRSGHLEASATVFRAFISLQLLGAIGFCVILCTAILFSSKVPRYSTWFSFCVAWILSCVSYSLLGFAGLQEDQTPKYSLCLAQAALIYSAPVVTGCATCSLAVQMLLNTRHIISGERDRRPMDRLPQISLIMIPYMIWFAMFAGILATGILYPEQVVRSKTGNYCDLMSPTPAKVSSFIVILATLASITIQGFIGRFLYINRHFISGSMHSLTMTFRVMFFTLGGAVAFGISVVYVIASKPGAEFDIVLAAIPVFAVILFGSQSDLRHAWMFWRKEENRHSLLASPTRTR